LEAKKTGTYRILTIYGMDMAPDLVALGFVFNDFHYKYLHKPTHRGLLDPEPSTKLYRFNPNTIPGIPFARSYLAHEVVSRIEVTWKQIRRQPVFSFEQRQDFYQAWKEYGWIHAQNLIPEMRALLAKREISTAKETIWKPMKSRSTSPMN
jgi:hypothetical protein